MLSNIQVGSEQLMQCREAMADFLGHHVHTSCVYKSRESCSLAPQSKKRKVEHIVQETDEENIYDGLKRLYSEDIFTTVSAGQTGTASSMEKCTLRTSCSLEMHQDCEDNTKSTSLLGQTLLVNWPHISIYLCPLAVRSDQIMFVFSGVDKFWQIFDKWTNYIKTWKNKTK